MMGEPTNDEAGCFWQADVDEAAGALLEVIEDVRPQVIVTYDDRGFYGHPDHIQAHRVAWRAFTKASAKASTTAGGLVSKFYATAVPKSVLARSISGGTRFTQVTSVDDLPFGVPDEQVTTEIDARDYLDAKVAAMRAHATQIAVDSPFFALSDNVGQRAFGTEYYTRLAGPGPGSSGGPGRESDLFAGLG
jgi:N-acetyl-1-D-myo-inositol-2-amino-2-deoxy-alpha-D-glucopyranoside deacetylase